MKKLIILSLAAITLPFLLLIAEKKEKQPVVKQVSSQEEISEPLILPGEVKADRQVTLRFQTSGLLTWVGVKEGDKVKKGQALASLDKRELEKTIKKEMNDYLKERWDFEQTHDNYQDEKDRHLITDEIKRILEKAQFDLNNAVLDYEIKKLALEYATLTSPIDGIVTKIDQPIAGVNITPATAEFTIADPDSVYFKVEADEIEVTQLHEGMTGKITLDAYSNQEFDTEITSISFAPDSNTAIATYTVKCPLPANTDLRFRLGMSGEIEL